MRPDLTVLALAPADFCARVVPALTTREAENGLPIGIARRAAGCDRAELFGVAALRAQSPALPCGVRAAGGDSRTLLLSVESAGTVVGAAVWTPPHDVVTTRLPPGAAQLVAEHCARSGQPITGASGPEGSGLELAEHLARLTHATARVRVRQRVYELTSVNELPRAAGAMRQANRTDIERIAAWYSEFVREANILHPESPEEWASGRISSGSAFVWEDADEARSFACLSRETPSGRAIGPVYTPPAARRQGYATSLVAELSRLILSSGKRFAVLFTDAANPTSNHIYESIGFRFVCPYDAYAITP